MQSIVPLLNVPAKGAGVETAKTTTSRTSGQNSESCASDNSNFMGIIEELTEPYLEQLDASLEPLDWMAVNEGATPVDLVSVDEGATAVDLVSVDEEATQVGLAVDLAAPTDEPADIAQQFTNTVTEIVSTVSQVTAEISSPSALQTTLQIPSAGTTSNSGAVSSEQTITRWNAFTHEAGETEKAFKASGDTTIQADSSNTWAKSDTAGNVWRTDTAVTQVASQSSTATDASAQLQSKAASNTHNTATTPETLPTGQTENIEIDKAVTQSVAQQKENTSSKTPFATEVGNPSVASSSGKTLSSDSAAKFTTSGKFGGESHTTSAQMSTQTSNTVTQGTNTVNATLVEEQTNTKAIKEEVRQQAHTSTNQTELDQGAVKSQSVTPSSSAKDASLSFASRWDTVTATSSEGVSDSTTADTTATKSDQSDVVRQIVQRMTLRNTTRQSQMTIKLKPEFLGNVQMQISMENQQVAVRMMTDSGVVKDIIEQNIQVLKNELQQHGLEIDKFDVYVGDDNDEHRNDQYTGWQRRSGQKERQSLNKNAEASSGSDENESIASDGGDGKEATTSNSEIDYFA